LGARDSDWEVPLTKMKNNAYLNIKKDQALIIIKIHLLKKKEERMKEKRPILKYNFGEQNNIQLTSDLMTHSSSFHA
jgi:hypothetical protein